MSDSETTKTVGETDGKISWGNEKARKLDEDILSYLQSVSGAIESPESPEEAVLLIANVFEEIQNKEASAASNKKASLVLEKLLKRASAQQVEQVLINFSSYFGFLCFNRFASHVIEALFTRAGHLFWGINYQLNESESSEADQISEADRKSLANIRDLIVGLSIFLRETEEWWNMAMTNTSTHIIRTLLHTLSGEKPISNKSKKRARSAANSGAHQLSHSGMFGGPNAAEKVAAGDKGKVVLNTFPAFADELQEYLNTVDNLSLKDLDELARNPYGCPVLQKLLQVCTCKSTRWVNIVTKLIPNRPIAVDSDAAKTSDVEKEEEEVGEEEKPSSKHKVTAERVKQAEMLAKHRTGSHLVEVIVNRAPKKVFKGLFTNFFLPRIEDFAMDKMANYVLQHCLESIRKEEQLEQVLEVLDTTLVTKLLQVGHLGVLVKVAVVAQRYPNSQKRVCKLITKSCQEWQRGLASSEDVTGPRSSTGPTRGVVESLLRLAPEVDEVAQVDATKKEHVAVAVNIIGAQLVGSLLAFNPSNNRTLIESTIGMSERALYRMCVDPIAGRHVIEVLFAHPVEASWAIQRLVTKLLGRMVDLAENKFGHHIVRKCFDSSTPKSKLAIVRVLSEADKRLKGSVFGTTVLQHVKVEQFQRHPETWKESSEQANRKRRKMDQWLAELN